MCSANSCTLPSLSRCFQWLFILQVICLISGNLLLRYSFECLFYHGVNTLWFECDIAFHRTVALAELGHLNHLSLGSKSQCTGFSLLYLGNWTTVIDQSSGPCKNFSATKTFDLPQIIPNTKDNRGAAWTFLAALKSHGTLLL